jgi:hypothetical protein
VTTDANGQIDLDDLNGSSGDTLERWHRILHVTDGTMSFPETEFAKVPLATTGNHSGAMGKSYYLRGNSLQVLPVASSLALTVSVNHMPQGIADLTAGSVSVEFPENSHSILAKEAASQLLMKGGAEMSAAEAWSKSAEKSRAAMLDQIRRRTMNPTMIGYPDHQLDWAGG